MALGGAAALLGRPAARRPLSLVRHYDRIHLAAGAPFAMATRNALPAGHPLIRLLWHMSTAPDLLLHCINTAV